MAGIFGNHNLSIKDIPHEESIKMFRDTIRNHIKENSSYYYKNVPISLKRYFDSKHKENKMSKELEKIENLTYGLLALLDEEDELVCTNKAISLVGEEDIEYDDGLLKIEIYRLYEDIIRFDYWSNDEIVSIQAFNFKNCIDRLLHYDVKLYETETKEKGELIDFSINLLSASKD